MYQHPMQRHRTVSVRIGDVAVGGSAPVVVQSMTNTDTEDVTATTRQIEELARAGSELVRITVNTEQAAAAVPHIRDALDAHGYSVPLIGDFHFNGHRLLTEHPDPGTHDTAHAAARSDPVNQRLRSHHHRIVDPAPGTGHGADAA